MAAVPVSSLAFSGITLLRERAKGDDEATVARQQEEHRLHTCIANTDAESQISGGSHRLGICLASPHPHQKNNVPKENVYFFIIPMPSLKPLHASTGISLHLKGLQGCHRLHREERGRPAGGETLRGAGPAAAESVGAAQSRVRARRVD